ncbi:MAG: hypothetical protein LBN97_06065 [Oscillospiraceae bacterium]|jgi:ABC-type glycerol-3-phosphate transport system substrate-binding protein|nr:hypothetical protein [Oscillospiraceae bacterium]
MKKTLALVLALALVFALFAACGSSSESNATPTTGSEATPAADTGDTTTPDTGDAATPANTAKTLTTQGRDYAVDDYDYPLEPFTYDMPLTTEDKVFTYFTLNFLAAAIPPEGLGSMPYQTMLRDKTGVHIDYQVVAIADMQQSLTLMLESDALTDIVTWASLYWTQGATSNMVSSGFYANIADYREDVPNFMYQVVRWDYNPELIASLWLNPETVIVMASYIDNSLPGTGYFIRGDWADAVGIPASSIKTYDQLHEYLVAVKNKYSTPDKEVYPIEFFKTIELAAGSFFGGFQTGIVSTAPMTRVVDGKVLYTQTQDVDYQALKLFLDWRDEDLVDPGYTGYELTSDYASKLTTSVTAVTSGNPSEMPGYEKASEDPGARFDYISFPLLKEGDTLKFGHGNPAYSYIGMGWSFSAKCSNLPVILNYADYFYTEAGSFDASYGVEGTGYDDPNATYYYDDDGAVQHTDFWLNGWQKYASMGANSSSWLMLGLYGNASFYEPGLSNHLANYAFEGGERFVEAMYAWSEQGYISPNPDGSNYDWPSAQAKMTDEQSAEFNSFSSDMNTWIEENYGFFLNDTTILTPETWDAWTDGLQTQTQFPRYNAIMQQVYDDYMANRG